MSEKTWNIAMWFFVAIFCAIFLFVLVASEHNPTIKFWGIWVLGLFCMWVAILSQDDLLVRVVGFFMIFTMHEPIIVAAANAEGETVGWRIFLTLFFLLPAITMFCLAPLAIRLGVRVIDSILNILKGR